MTIKFICTCGKHLKARDEMAARRSVCPRCGAPVGIPSLKPTHAGTVAAPLNPDERRRWAKERQPLPVPPMAPAAQADKLAPRPPRAAPRLVHLLSNRKQRPDLKGRHLEKHWYQCFLYPLRTCHLCFGLAAWMMIISATGAMAGPRLLEQGTALTGGDNTLGLAGFRLACMVLLVLVVGLPCSFLDCVLASATAGEVYYLRWSGDPVSAVLLSGSKWLTCFLAGPVVVAATGWVYWVSCGDGLVDWLILTELGVVAVAYWLYVLLALTDRGRLRDLNPLAVADLAHRLGWRGLGVVLLAAVLLLGHGALLLFGIAALHTAPGAGCLLLAGGWVSGLFWSTFFCRLLGVWCYRSRKVTPTTVPGGA